MNRLDRSAALHAEVQAFAAGASARTFTELACEIAEFQREFSPGFARLLARYGGSLARLEDIPGVPTDTFRLTRVATHPPEEDVVRFATSGTTSGERGIHALRTLETYRAVALNFGRRALLTSATARRVVALAPRLDEPPTSSLGHMMALFMADFDPEGAGARASERWLIDQHGVNVRGLVRAVDEARAVGAELLVLSTSFALVALLDELGGRTLAAPVQTVVMQTGGFKGKSREIPRDELRQSVARTFGITETRVVSEYGMTELTSQLYEATVPGSKLAEEKRGHAGIYYEPAWLRVIPVDPITLTPVADGEVGIARIVDLANIDTAVAIQTQDRVRRVEGGIELLGRAPGATPRGCSLAIEEFLQARS